LTEESWTEVARRLKKDRGGLGDLGGGNHFLDALQSQSTGQLYILIHTGSRKESGLVDDLVDQPAKFDSEFERIVDWARKNRATVQKTVEEVLGDLELILDLPHNTYEKLSGGGAIVRKGSAKTAPGDLNIIPAHLGDDVALVRATEQVENTLYSLSHGTGRDKPTSEAKWLSRAYEPNELREEILDEVIIPDLISDRSLRGEGPHAYRDLETCLNLLEGYVEEIERFKIVGYVGHL